MKNVAAEHEEQLARELSEVANAVQAASLLAGLHRRQSDALAETTQKMEDALERAIKALQRLSAAR